MDATILCTCLIIFNLVKFVCELKCIDWVLRSGWYSVYGIGKHGINWKVEKWEAEGEVALKF